MLKLLLGDPNARKLKRYQPIVSDIQLLEEEIAPLSDDELRGKTAAFQERLASADHSRTNAPSSTRFFPKRSPWCAKPASVSWGCATRCATHRRHGFA